MHQWRWSKELLVPRVAVTPAELSKSVSEDAPKGPRKFMLGVNSPVVQSRIVKRILSADFGDMAELSNEREP